MRDKDSLLTELFAEDDISAAWEDMLFPMEDSPPSEGGLDAPEYRQLYENAAAQAVQAEADRRENEARRQKKARRIRRLKGMAAVAAALVALLAFTDAGKALYYFVREITNDEVRIEMTTPQGPYPQFTDFEKEEFSSVKEASQFLHFPLFGWESMPTIKSEKVALEHHQHTGILMHTEYDLGNPDTDYAYVSYEVMEPDVGFGGTTFFDDGGISEYELFNGETFYYSISEEDGRRILAGSATWCNENLFVVVSLSGDASDDDYLAYLDKLKLIK